jgi:multisubunit Na+/H+ antiporter MnhF subunit
MAKITILFGVLLFLLGVVVWVATGRHAPTALIPAYLGIVLSVLGLVARTQNQKRRMLMMHIAVTLALLGFLATAKSIWDFIQLERGHMFARPVAVEDKAVMSVMLLIYVLLCVRSFIKARRQPVASSQ